MGQHLLCVVAGQAGEIKRLKKRFKKLDLDGSGSLSVGEFMSLPELQQNPLVPRVIDIFDTDGDGEIDFRGERRLPCRFRPMCWSTGGQRGPVLSVAVFAEFMEGISQFSVGGSREQKLQCESVLHPWGAVRVLQALLGWGFWARTSPEPPEDPPPLLC